MRDWLQLFFMNILPKRTISRIAGWFGRSKLSKPLITAFASHFSINLAEAEYQLSHYQSLTDFFIRRLKPGLRPIAEGEDVVISPVDGVASELGLIEKGSLIQAKGVSYTILQLLGGDEVKTKRFQQGTYVTIYLSPRDYHRIHAPIEGEVVGSTYVPGTLFPVNAFGVRAVKGLFARNERLITYFTSKAGLVSLVKVGATIVGSVKVNYDSIATNVPKGKLDVRTYTGGKIYGRGEEVGRFEFGSTVILLFEPGRVKLGIKTGDRVLMGQKIGNILPLQERDT